MKFLKDIPSSNTGRRLIFGKQLALIITNSKEPLMEITKGDAAISECVYS